MRNNYLRRTIIILIQFTVPALLSLNIVPLFLSQTVQVSQIQLFFNTHQPLFLFIHVLFYLALFWVWPRLITIRYGNQSDPIQLKTAFSARWYLLAAMAFFELLVWWR